MHTAICRSEPAEAEAKKMREAAADTTEYSNDSDCILMNTYSLIDVELNEAEHKYSIIESN